MAGDFLKGLPSFNKENFTRFNADGIQAKISSKRPTVCIQFKEDTQTKPQVIITDKTNILLRYLRQQSDVKNVQQKRCLSSSENPSPSRKIPRIAASTSNEGRPDN